jgi:hypothetical protein
MTTNENRQCKCSTNEMATVVSMLRRCPVPSLVAATFKYAVLLPLLMAQVAFAADLSAVALPKVGSCPSGYLTSGAYCLAGNNAKHAIRKSGSCPSGYMTSGRYCLNGSNRQRINFAK